MPRLSSVSVALLIGSACCALACGEGGSDGSNPSAGASGGGASNAGTTSVGLGGHDSSGGSIGQAGTSAPGGAAGTGTGGGCQGALICDDFESYTDKPAMPWGVNVDGAGAGKVVIDTARHYSGSKSVKFTTSGAASYQQAYIMTRKPFPLANNAFYGRMMIYATKAANDGVHWTMIMGEGTRTDGITRAYVRYGGQQQQSLMANYDSLGKPSDCWQHSQTKMPEGKWACMEWYFEGATNTQKFWLDGQAIDDLTVVGQGQGCIAHDTEDKWLFPTFDNLYLGWESYQTDDPREVWIDDVAISTTQIGCPP